MASNILFIISCENESENELAESSTIVGGGKYLKRPVKD